MLLPTIPAPITTTLAWSGSPLMRLFDPPRRLGLAALRPWGPSASSASVVASASCHPSVDLRSGARCRRRVAPEMPDDTIPRRGPVGSGGDRGPRHRAAWRGDISQVVLRMRAYKGRVMHLLVVEDDQRLRRLLKRLLEEDRHVVEVAADGTSAVAMATGTPGIDAVILDVGLPDFSGLEVARRIRAAGRRPVDPDAHRPRHGRRPGRRPRRRGRRLPGQAVRLRGALGPPAGALAARRGRRPAGRAEAASPARSSSTRPPGRSRSAAVRSTSARASSRCSSASCATSARPSAATSSSTRPGHSASPSRRTRSTPTSTTCARSSARRASQLETVRGIGYRLASG